MTWNDDVLVGSVIFKNLRILFFWRKMSNFFKNSYLRKYKDSKNGNLINEIVSSRPFQRPFIYSYLLLPSVDNPPPMKNLRTLVDALVGRSIRLTKIDLTKMGFRISGAISSHGPYGFSGEKLTKPEIMLPYSTQWMGCTKNMRKYYLRSQ